MSAVETILVNRVASSSGRGAAGKARRRYWLFALPALALVLGIIVFPWLFTVLMSVSSWKVGENWQFVGVESYRFQQFGDGGFRIGHVCLFFCHDFNASITKEYIIGPSPAADQGQSPETCVGRRNSQ